MLCRRKGSRALLLQDSKAPQPHLQTVLDGSAIVEIPWGAVEVRFRMTVSTQLVLPSQLHSLALRSGDLSYQASAACCDRATERGTQLRGGGSPYRSLRSKGSIFLPYTVYPDSEDRALA